MAITDEQYQEAILKQVGDVNGVVAAEIEVYWEMFADQEPVRLQFLYAKREAIDLLQGYVREQVNQRDPELAVDYSDKLKALQTMRNNVTAEIAKLEAAAADDAVDEDTEARQPVIGELTTTAPISPDFCGQADANDRRYRGDAYRRLR